MRLRAFLLVATVAAWAAAPAWAQDRGWAADVSVGWAGFVDDATKHYWLFGGSVRHFITAGLSIGPEIVVMSNSHNVRDPNVLLTGNVMFETSPDARLSPFVVGGAGIFWGRDQVTNGPFWSSEPAFSAGAGVRGKVTDAMTAAVEYRLGWELHHRLSATVGVRW